MAASIRSKKSASISRSLASASARLKPRRCVSCAILRAAIACARSWILPFTNKFRRFVYGPHAPSLRLSLPEVCTSRRLQRRMLDQAPDIHLALALSCLGKIIRGLHPQPHVGAPAEGLFKAQRHLRRDGASTLHHVVKLLARN